MDSMPLRDLLPRLAVNTAQELSPNTARDAAVIG